MELSNNDDFFTSKIELITQARECIEKAFKVHDNVKLSQESEILFIDTYALIERLASQLEKDNIC